MMMSLPRFNSTMRDEQLRKRGRQLPLFSPLTITSEGISTSLGRVGVLEGRPIKTAEPAVPPSVRVPPATRHFLLLAS